MFLKLTNEIKTIVIASYVVANLIAQKSKSYSDGEFIKQSVADIICPGIKEEFSKISLSHQTFAR